MLTIRFATSDDCPVILNFIKALAEFEKLQHEVVATEENLRSSLFSEKSAEVLLAFWDNKPAGFALFFYNYSTFLAQKGLYLEDLFVAPEFRSFGIGKSLLQKLSRIAVERNCGRLEWSVLDWNTRAIKFYLSIGAKPNDEWTTYRMTEPVLKKFSESF